MEARPSRWHRNQTRLVDLQMKSKADQERRAADRERLSKIIVPPAVDNDNIALEQGKFYRDRWGDVHGPMDERVPGCWLDQHGAVYQTDGRQWNHLSESMSTIIEECQKPDPAF